ncbi:MAG: hypothetical protein Q8861_01730 [Bacteroidota bacterium]|nr:hypothetical protein [Bacteroidota bacterium]MDP4271758.1 hypothetical protein [Bacteroidota bacterium]
MKKISFLLTLFVGLVFVSCQKVDVTFPYAEMDTNNAELRVLNVMPYTENSDTLWLSGVRYSMVATKVGGYYPNSTPRYFSMPLGNNNVMLNFLPKIDPVTKAVITPAWVYKGVISNLQKGKWSAYVYDKTKDPIMLQDSDYLPNFDQWKDTVCFVRFSNFFLKKDGVTPFGNLTLKIKKNITGAAWETVATSVPFGTQSAYYKYKLKNTTNTYPWTGSEANITIAVWDDGGNQLQQFNASGVLSAFSVPSLTLGKGRAYVFYMNGKQGTTNSSDQYIRLSSFNVK